MTACTNNGGSRARRAVTAALVGVLSVGAAPMVALATGAAPASADVMVMAEVNDTVWNGSVSYTGEDRATFTFNGKAQGIEAKTLTPQGTDMDEVELKYNPADGTTCTTGDYYYFYVKLDSSSSTTWTNGAESVTYKNAKGAPVEVKGSAVSKPSAIGDYAVLVGRYTGTGWELVKSAYTFSIKAQSLADANLFEINVSDPEDTSDRDFAYTGKADCDQVDDFLATLGVELNGTILSEGDDASTPSVEDDHYDVTIWKLNGASALSNTDYLVPGEQYVAKLTGKGVYDKLSVDKTFTYGKLNLETADVVTKLFTGTGSVPSANSSLSDIVDTINGVGITGNFGGSDSRVAIKCTGVPSGSTAGAKGTYTFELSANGEAGAKYVTGTKTVTVTYADFQANIDFTGCADGISAGANSMTTDLSKDKPNYFDPSDIKVTYDHDSSSSTPEKELDSDQYVVTITDADGDEVNADALKNPGEYTIKVTVDYTNDYDQLISRAASFKVTVNYGTINDSNVYVSFDGKNVPATGFSTDYTGEDLLDGISVKTVKGDKTFVEGTDYTVEVTRLGSDGKWVEADEIVNAGDYKVTVKGIAWKGTETFEFEVKPVTLSTAVPSKPFAAADGVTLDTLDTNVNAYYLNHTGEELVPELTFKDAKGNTWALAADGYEASYEVWNGAAWVDADLKNEGFYRIKGVKITDENFAGTSISLPGKTYIVVTNTRSFVDVANDAWYADAVATAKQEGYIGGIGGTNFFAPLQNMSRADVVCVLYRMAGGTIASSDEGLTNEQVATISQFNDVDKNAYYARAIAWATKAGIVRGYGDTFGVGREVTTEEFATMLHRYATLVGNAGSVDADAVLAGVADGDEVSGYAREAVAWAVENGYVASNGNLIDPQGSVYRARVVTIAVRYQPEQLDTIVDTGDTADTNIWF